MGVSLVRERENRERRTRRRRIIAIGVSPSFANMELTTPLLPRQCTPLLPTPHITGRHRGVKWWEKFINFFSLVHTFQGTLDCITAVYQGNLEARGLSIFDYHVPLPTILKPASNSALNTAASGMSGNRQTMHACTREGFRLPKPRNMHKEREGRSRGRCHEAQMYPARFGELWPFPYCFTAT